MLHFFLYKLFGSFALDGVKQFLLLRRVSLSVSQVLNRLKMPPLIWWKLKQKILKFDSIEWMKKGCERLLH